MWRGFKWSALNWKMFCFLLGLGGRGLSPDQRSETWSQLQVCFIPEYSINTLISCFFCSHFYVSSFCVQNLNDLSSVILADLSSFYRHIIRSVLIGRVRLAPDIAAQQGSAQVSICDPSLDVVLVGAVRTPDCNCTFTEGRSPRGRGSAGGVALTPT